ncbi:IgGFc-binding protein-like [Sorex fumeus]|uniref:IgGFc-binding protein-like n=1 Tax=Sorex fumeus TaxID=62283 RepID=UPI0024ACF8CB|nr:IgGFc-binding protein-like [Sorex fumeus]
MRIFGTTITAVKHEFGFIRVNQQQMELPVTLGDGQLRLSFRSSELWAEAGLEREPVALRLVYDWQYALSLQLAAGYRGHVAGLCGNFNGDPSDDQEGPDPRAFLHTWGLQLPNDPCRTLWAAPCTVPTAPLWTPEPCGVLAAPNGPFRLCHAVLPSASFESSCRAWTCSFPNHRPALCQAIQVYARACQRLGVSIDSWRFQAGCPIDCPPNSHYEPCGSSCPETCVSLSETLSCHLPCGETCACDAGYERRGPLCILRRRGLVGCGCTHGGHRLAPGEEAWEGAGCTRRCLCPAAGGVVVCRKAGCSPAERCALADARPFCRPRGPATCTAAGGGHYVTFDGRRFRFPSSSCAYLLSGLRSPAPRGLADFRVLQSTGPEGAPSSLEVHVPGFHLRLDAQEPGRVMVNGDWQNLPFRAPDNGTLIFRRGWDTVVHCSFGLHVIYAPEIRVALDLPEAYRGHVVGLCADYNGDPLDDLRVPGVWVNPELPEDALAWAFGHSCLVDSSAGCPDAAAKIPPPLPSCVTLSTSSTSAHFSHSCSILLDPRGPFQLCHELLAPKPYFQDCLVGVCQGTGPCPMLSLYCEACQLLGLQVAPWRKASLCSPLCPAHAHYSLCAPACPITCAGPEPAPSCGGDRRCREGCVCDPGFVQSGAACVPVAQCGCLLGGHYFEPGAPLPPLGPSSTTLGPCCRCHAGGRVICAPCQVAQDSPGLCLAWGGLGYRTFDGATIHLPGSCTPLLVGTGRARLQGVWPFHVTLERGAESSSARHVLLHVQGHRFSLHCQDWGYLMVDGVRACLPFTLPSGGVRAFTRGATVVLVVRGGPQLLFHRDCHLSVVLPNAYRNLTQGLCGNFNGHAQDDMPLYEPCPTLHPCPGSGCPTDAQVTDVVTDTNTVWPSACDLLREPSSPLAPCHPHLPPQPFFQACTADVGSAHGSDPVICAWLQAYVAACHMAGASVRPWRGPSFCSPCLGVQEVVQLPTPCAEGCECDEGFFPAGGDCVPMDYCSCFYNGQYFPPGQTILSHNCSSSCSCRPLGGVSCVPFSCPPGTVCGIADGVLGCRASATLVPVLSPVTPTRFVPPLLPTPRSQCPANSHFVPCGSMCPATCAHPSAPEHCGQPCAPVCQCLPGFLLLEDRCVPPAHCLCLQHHHHTFWTANCTQRCRCLALESQVVQCQPDTCSGHCKASADGWERCLLGQSLPGGTGPEEPLICTVAGDFHFHTFGGAHYEFSGSCVYRLVGLCGSHPAGLESFSLDVAPLLQPHSCPKALTLSACGLRVDMNPKDPNHIRVNGILESLPFSHGSCLHAYLRGYQLCIETTFGLLLTYDWHGLVRVTLPRSYGPYLCGLCGTSGPTAPEPDAWKVAEVPGCGPNCGPLCPSPCPVAARQPFSGDRYCGLLTSAQGPLEPCHAALDPQPFLSDCLVDTCRRRGAQGTVCRALAAYTTACQALGVRLWPWRTPDFCPLQCPPHSQYELCGPCCPATCAGSAGCEAPGAPGGRCCEGCVCQAGFVLSGGLCVPAAQCGCLRAGRYRPRGAVWYPGPGCARRCRCGPAGVVTCAPQPCARGQVCGLRGGVRRCLPNSRAYCALAGSVHVLDFDGHARALPLPAPFSPKRCLDVLARTTRPGAWPFSLDVARDGTGPLSLHFSLAGRRLQLDRHAVGVIMVDGERWRLPWALPGGQVWATLEGRHVVVHAACGLRLLYDWGEHVRLSVPSTFHGRLAGLCGAFGDDEDPLGLPLDTKSSPTGPVATPCPLPAADLGFSINCSVQLAPLFKAPKLCGILQASDGPFGHCLGQVDPTPFLRICLQEECHSQDGSLELCKILTAYTAACQEAGIPVLPWRGPNLCPMSCPPRRRYSICAQTCAGGCVLPTSPAHCATLCYEGCECEPGLVFDGTDCISRNHCGCLHNGHYVPVGEALILPGCRERCVCAQGHGLQCQPFACSQGTDCILEGGAWCCEAGGGATCHLVPGGLFTTFDGFSGLAPAPVTPCAYELASLMGSGPQDPDWFHVIADFPPCPGCPTSQPRVIISFRDGCAAVGPNREVWVNGRRARLPAQVCRGVVARQAEGSGVIIERSPMLRMLVGPHGAVALRASSALRGRLRAACGDYNGIAADDLVLLPRGLRGASLGDAFQGCLTRSLSSCTEQLPAGPPPFAA